MTVLGDFHAEKVHVREEMNRRIDSLLSDLILTPSMKEYAFKTSIVSVFRYSAGLVPWSMNELLEINAMWSRAYTRFWWRRNSAREIDASPVLVASTEGGLDCPSAIEEWTQEVLTLYEQYLFLPGKVGQIIRHHLYQACLDHGLTALSQLQQVLCLNGQAHSDSVVELFLWRLYEHGLEISSPWEPMPGHLIVDILWTQLIVDIPCTQLCWAWRSKEEWAGCSELDSVVERKWMEAEQCLNVLRQLGKSVIVTLQALKGLEGRGLSLTIWLCNI